MKAIDIIKRMVQDPMVAEKAIVVEYDSWNGTHSVRAWCKEQFGAEPVSAGRLKEGQYLAIYEVDGNDTYPLQYHFEPEITLRRIDPEQYPEDDRLIWLWRIE